MLSTDKQIDWQTDKLTNATKNITSFAKEVKGFREMKIDIAIWSRIYKREKKNNEMN